MDNQDEGIFYFCSPPLQCDTTESDSSCFSFDAPSFSPITSTCSMSMSEVSSLCNEEQNDPEQVDEEPLNTDRVNLKEVPLTLEEVSASVGDPSASASNTSDQLYIELPSVGEVSTCLNEVSVAGDNVTNGSECMHNTIELPIVSISNWPGFKIDIDNIDKNFRPSFKRHDNKTISMHACNIYACQDRIDFSSLSDVNPVTPKIDVQKLLIGEAEVDSLNGDAVVLLSR